MEKIYPNCDAIRSRRVALGMSQAQAAAKARGIDKPGKGAVVQWSMLERRPDLSIGRKSLVLLAAALDTDPEGFVVRQPVTPALVGGRVSLVPRTGPGVPGDPSRRRVTLNRSAIQSRRHALGLDPATCASRAGLTLRGSPDYRRWCRLEALDGGVETTTPDIAARVASAIGVSIADITA